MIEEAIRSNMETKFKEPSERHLGEHHTLCPRVLANWHVDCHRSVFSKSIKGIEESQHVTCSQMVRNGQMVCAETSWHPGLRSRQSCKSFFLLRDRGEQKM